MVHPHPADNPSALDSMVDAYVETALWASDDSDDGDGGELSTAEGLESQSLVDARAECLAFARLAGSDACLVSARELGGDFFLTRCGHGSGFWDRGLGKAGDRLTALASRFGSVDLFLAASGFAVVDHVPDPQLLGEAASFHERKAIEQAVSEEVGPRKAARPSGPRV